MNTKTERQIGIVKKWAKNGGKGTLVAATGFGKTRVAIEIIKKLRAKKPDLTVIVVVPTKYLRDEWGGRIIENGIGTKIKVIIINTLALGDVDNYECDLLVLDEVHVYAADKFRRVFERVKYKYIVSLTATLDPEKYEVISPYSPKFEEVTMEECLRNDWVADYIIYNLAVSLTDDEREEYKSLSSKFNRAFAIFNSDMNLMFEVLRNERVRRDYARRRKLSPNQIVGYARLGSTCMRKRKEILYNSKAKLDACLEIIEHFPDKKIITFNQKIEVADYITQEIGDDAVSYHSQIEGREIHGVYYGKKKMKQLNMMRFKEGQVRVLNTAKSLDMGADLPDIDMALTVSGTGSSTQGRQRLGRAVRYKYGKRAIFIEIFVDRTQDRTWLMRRQTDIPRGLIRWVSSINEII